MCVVTGIMTNTFKHMKDTLHENTHIHTYYVNLVPRPTSQLRMDYITLQEYRSGDVIHPQVRCGSGYETNTMYT